ncbi:MAG: 50S ribosomal protein L32 [Vampirovibrionales bacterium]
MPVPKKRLGSSRQNSRRANWKGFLPSMTNCSHCGAPKLSHHVCGACGYYKGKLVSYRFSKALALPEGLEDVTPEDEAG